MDRFWRNSGNSRKFPEIPEIPRDKFVQFREIREIRPRKNMIFTETALRSRVPSGNFGGKSGHFRTFFFRKCHKFAKKMQKKCKKTQKMQKFSPRKTPRNFRRFFAKTGLWRFVRGYEKGSKNAPEIPRKFPVHTFFPEIFPEGHFRGFFGTFNLKSRKKNAKKGCFFDVFLEKISSFFSFYRLEVDGPTFYMRRKSELHFFDRKVRNTFSDFWSDFVLFLLDKIGPEKKTQRLDFTPIGPLLRRGGSVFLTFFLFRFQALKVRPRRDRELFCSTII